MDHVGDAVLVLDNLRKFKEETCDNSILIPEAFVTADTCVDMRLYWSNYLKAKFRFLRDLLLHDEKYARGTTKAAASSGDLAWISSYVDKWLTMADREGLAYKYRVSQLPIDKVRETWYWATRENQYCVDWCGECEKELKSLDADIRCKKLKEVCEEAVGKIGEEPASGFNEDYKLSYVCKQTLLGLTKHLNELHLHLAQVPRGGLGQVAQAAERCEDLIELIEDHFRPMSEEAHAQIDDLDTDVLTNRFLRKLSLRLIEEFYTEGFDETILIRAFLLELKKQFSCEVCDYLEVSGSKIEWWIATTNHDDLGDEYKQLSDDEIRRRVRKDESYGLGVGISGSIMLQDSPVGRNTWFHIGSNDVVNDPRQSPRHLSAYQRNLYKGVLSTGAIRNFWMFPIFVGGSLRGAFRVVNRLNADGQTLLAGGWAYHTRTQLAIIADWFSAFLRAIRPQVQSKEDFREFFSRREALNTMVARLDLGWIQDNETVIPAAVRHLMRTMARREEEHSLGACIIIVKDPDKNTELQGLDLEPYPFLKGFGEREFAESFASLSSYHHAVVPERGAFVFDQEGKFWAAVQLAAQDDAAQTRGGVPMLGLLTERCSQSVALLLPRDSRSIQVYRTGSLALQIRMSERSGAWRFRYPDDLYMKLRELCTSWDEEVWKAIVDSCLYLSYRGLGALIILGDFPLDAHLSLSPAGPEFRIESRIQEIGPVLFAEFAKLEGATFVGKEGIIRRVNVIVDSLEPTGHLNLGMFPNKGSRHTTGALIAQLEKESVVIVVSHNRGISVVAHGGETLYKNL